MKRGTKEFYDIQKNFEKAVDSGLIGYIPSSFAKSDFGSYFYENGAVDMAFKSFYAGYAAGASAYRQ